MKKKAVAYVSDIILGSTGDVIGRSYQKEMIREYADEHGIEIVAWFEDEIYEEDLMRRPGIRKLLDHPQPFDFFLVERVWSLSRNWKKLQAFFEKLESRRIALDCATTMWDCVSQMSRHRFNDSLCRPTHLRAAGERPGRGEPSPIRKNAAIRQPARLNFADLVSVKAYSAA